MKITLEARDYDEIRGMAQGNIPFVPTNDQINAALALEPGFREPSAGYLLGTAHEWGWNDTEVRDALCLRLERVGQAPANAAQS